MQLRHPVVEIAFCGFALNHPNIAQIDGLEDQSSAGAGQPAVHAIAMELVEGEDLAERLARGALPLDESLPIARQIAEALRSEAGISAVRRGIIPVSFDVLSRLRLDAAFAFDDDFRSCGFRRGPEMVAS